MPDETTTAFEQRVDGTWFHFDARPPEPAVIHPPRSLCRMAGRHPQSSCWYHTGPSMTATAAADLSGNFRS